MQDFKYGFYRWARKEAKKVISNEVRAGWGGYSQDLVSLGNFFVSVENNLCWREKTCWEAKFQVYFLFLAKSRFISVVLEYSRVAVPWTLAFISIFVEVPGCSSQDSAL